MSSKCNFETKSDMIRMETIFKGSSLNIASKWGSRQSGPHPNIAGDACSNAGKPKPYPNKMRFKL